MANYIPTIESLLASGSSRSGFSIRNFKGGNDPVYGDVGSNTRTYPTSTSTGGYLPNDWKEIYVDKLIIGISSPNFGVVVGNVDRTLTIESTYSVDKTLNSITVPSGFEITPAPSYPITISPKSVYTYTIRATATGPATVSNETITLTFADQTLVISGISALRSVLIKHRPLNNLGEELEWKTVIHQSLSGKEQRSGVRRYPRQILIMEIETAQGSEDMVLSHLLAFWQPKSVVIPIWFEPMALTAAASIGATTISVDETRYADVRDGGLVALVQGNEAKEIIEVESHTQDSITFSTPLQNAYTTLDEAFPAHPCTMQSDIVGLRHKTAIHRDTIVFEVIDNAANIADASAFSSLNSKPFLDEPNEIEGSQQAIRHFTRMATLDSETGRKTNRSVWPYGRKGFTKTWKTLDRQGLWEKRQLLHYLEGMRASFYYPSFTKDLIPVEDIASGVATLNIQNVGFATNTGGLSPYNQIRVVKTDGTTIERAISSASEVDESTETISVDSNWGENVAQASISRIEILHLCRLDTDRVQIKHLHGNGQAVISFPIVNTKT